MNESNTKTLIRICLLTESNRVESHKNLITSFTEVTRLNIDNVSLPFRFDGLLPEPLTPHDIALALSTFLSPMDYTSSTGTLSGEKIIELYLKARNELLGISTKEEALLDFISQEK